MTNFKATKRALLSSVIALVLCFSMLLGTTFAWFTDSVTSSGNIIQTGTLKVTMEWKDATANGPQQTYQDASTGTIFNNEKWEPGYVEAKNIKIGNIGTLALQYNLRIVANGEVSEIADVIDVYYAEGEHTLASRDMTELKNIGTLKAFLEGMPDNMTGSLEAHTENVITLAFKMREDAGNQYQGLSIGANFSVVLMATQDNVEKDSFDENYDDIEIPEMHIEKIDGVTYGAGVDGNYYMISVDDYTLTNFTVANNVTVLGTGNGVNDNDRVFGKNAPLTSLVLPEGLTEIKDNALNALPNLTSVNMPSTLKTIGIQAFRQTGMSELTIPENVETVKLGAFRDMANLTTVTVEGNVVFDNYAFRSCPSLTDIYLLGDDVTFTGGQFATHSDNGDATGITIYVKNATVAARLYAAQTSAYGYEVKILGAAADGSDAQGVAQVKTQAKLDEAIANGDSVVLGAGTYTFPASSIAADTTIVCADGVVFDGKTGLNINGATVIGATFTNDNDYLVNSTTINGTFKDCVFTDCDGLRYCYAGETVVFENCVFDTDFYGVHFDGGANDVIFRNCTFTGFNTFGSAITNLVMENCTFKYNGKGGYNGINLWGNAEMTNCTFVFDGSASYEWVDLCSSNQTVTFTGCVVTDGTTERPLKDVVGNYGDGNTIIIDGETADIPNMN